MIKLSFTHFLSDGEITNQPRQPLWIHIPLYPELNPGPNLNRNPKSYPKS